MSENTGGTKRTERDGVLNYVQADDRGSTCAVHRTIYDVRTIAAAGEIEVVHIGRSARVPLDAIRTFVEDQRVSR